MKPRYYLDISVFVPVEAGGAAMANYVMTILMARLHAACRASPGSYAVALPDMREGTITHGPHPGNRFRVFAEETVMLHALRLTMGGHPRIGDTLTFAEIKEVPADYSGPWREYRRYRTPNRRSFRLVSRAKRMEEGRHLPYFRVRSLKTKESFSIRVQRLAAAPTTHCEPDSYGLSRFTQSFALPEP